MQDPDGSYVRRWVPELAKLPTKHLFAPWEAPPATLTQAGVELGETYPERIITTPVQVHFVPVISVHLYALGSSRSHDSSWIGLKSL